MPNSLEKILETKFFAGKLITLILWVDTNTDGKAITRCIDISLPKNMPKFICAQIIKAIDEKVTILAIKDGCRMLLAEDSIEFAKKPCEGCE
jgi:hypothetical protein